MSVDRGDLSGWRIETKKPDKPDWQFVLATVFLCLLTVILVGGQVWVCVHFIRKFW